MAKEVCALVAEGRASRGGRDRVGRVRLVEVRRPRVAREVNFRAVEVERDILV